MVMIMSMMDELECFPPKSVDHLSAESCSGRSFSRDNAEVHDSDDREMMYHVCAGRK
jgi:hypothetical protein